MSDPIVITGVGAVTPLGSSREEVWENFQKNESVLKERIMSGVMPVRFGSVAPEGTWKQELDLGFLTEDEHDAISRDEGLTFGIAATSMALRESGFEVTPENRTRVGVILGSSKGQLQSLLKAHMALREAGTPLFSSNGRSPFTQNFRNFPGVSLGSLIARKIGAEGPVLNYAAACATGINCIVAAVHLLQDHVVDAVITGSCESSGNAVTLASFENMGALSKDPVRPFHKDRNGFNAGEGAGAFILERESDARRRGAHVYGRIAGWDYRSDAHHITAVERGGTAIEHAIRLALKRAGWETGDVEFINAHGTGTDLNDYTEATVIERVFGSPGPYVSSLKAHVGHLLGASAGVELALTMIALEKGFVFPTLFLDEPDPEFHVNFVPADGVRKQVHKYMKFSYGFGGHIGVLALERD